MLEEQRAQTTCFQQGGQSSVEAVALPAEATAGLVVRPDWPRLHWSFELGERGNRRGIQTFRVLATKC